MSSLKRKGIHKFLTPHPSPKKKKTNKIMSSQKLEIVLVKNCRVCF